MTKAKVKSKRGVNGAKPKPAAKVKPSAKGKPTKVDKNLRGWMWAAAAACQEAADMGEEAINGRSFEASIARTYLERVKGQYAPPKKMTFRAVAQSLWDTLGVDPLEDWIEGGRYSLSPYHLRIVQDEAHYLYDVRGSEKTDPNPKEFAALVDAVAAIGWIMQAVMFTEEGGRALVADGRRRVRAARAYNLRQLAAASPSADDSRAEPPTLIESIPATCILDRAKLEQVKNGSNYHRCAEDALRQLAGIQQLERTMPLVAIAAMMGVTTQTLANQRSLASLSASAREALRAGEITLTLAYRLARELPARQDGALEATKTLPAKARQRAVEAWLAGDSPEAEARALRARDVRSLAKRVAESRDPDLAPLRALFAVLRGNDAAVSELPKKWRDCLGLADEGGATGGTSDVSAEVVAAVSPVPAVARRQLDIDDGVPESMRVRCPQCEAEPTEYCIGDGSDEEEQWGTEDGTRIHQARIVTARRSRMPELPAIGASPTPTPPAKKRGRKGDGKTELVTNVESAWLLISDPRDIPLLKKAGITPEECALTCHLEREELALGDTLPLAPLAQLLNENYLTVADLSRWVQEMREAASEVVCTTCGADVDHPCDAERPHVARMKLAERARELRPAATGEAA